MKWENVYVFISSTFNDMHGERDYLIKRVFPQLRSWCAQRKLKLMDIDLRWGVSEMDATENKRVVDVCLKNIDKCRPFFLCFLGQRRGWVPQIEDINPKTWEDFPELRQYIGVLSVTELEIMHALLHPMNVEQKPVRHSMFCFRSDDYVKTIKSSKIRELYAPGYGRFIGKGDKELKKFKAQIEETQNVCTYEGVWNSEIKSPELVNIKGMDLSQGRLEQFQTAQGTLGDAVLAWLKQAITEEFPEHMEKQGEQSELEKELDLQDAALFAACDAYIERSIEEKLLEEYVNSTDTTLQIPLVISAEAGAGKTSLLAHFIQKNEFQGTVLYRLIGSTVASSTMRGLAASLVGQMASLRLIDEKKVRTEDEMLLLFSEFLESGGKKKPILLILDGVDQFNEEKWNLNWIPSPLPANVKVIVTMKEEGNQKLLADVKERGMYCCSMGMLEEDEQKRQLIRGYLNQFLKDIDDNQIEKILKMPGSRNLLYLKIVLNELRVFGSFDSLMEKLNTDYGNTPQEAFGVMIDRMIDEADKVYKGGGAQLKVFLWMLAYSREGLHLPEIANVVKNHVYELKSFSEEEILDRFYIFSKQLGAYLAVDGDYVKYLYESMRIAVKLKEGREKPSLLLLYYYYNRLRKRATQHDCVEYLYHTIRAGQKYADPEFKDVVCLQQNIKVANSREVAKACLDGAFLGYDGYQELGEILNTGAERLDVNVDTLFMECRRGEYADVPIIKELLAQENTLFHKPYFEPMKKRNEIVVEKQYRLKGKSPHLYLAKDCLVVSDGTSLWTLNKMTWEVIRKMTFPPTSSFHTDDERLYVGVLFNENDELKPEHRVYKLPWLEHEKTFQRVESEPDFEFYNTHDYEGNTYFVYQNKESAGIWGCSEAYLQDVMTGEVIWREIYEETRRHYTGFIYKGLNTVRFVNHYFIGRVDATGDTMIYSLKERKKVFSIVTPLYSDIFVTQNGDNLYFIYSSISLKGREDKCFQLRPDEEDNLQLVREVMLPEKSIYNVSTAGKEIYVIAEGVVYVYDLQLNFIGCADIGALNPSNSAEGHFQEVDGYLLYFHSEGINYYRKERFFNSLSKDIRAVESRDQVVRIDCVAKDGYLYFLEKDIRRIKMDTMMDDTENMEDNQEKSHYKTDKIIIYDQDNIYKRKYLLGCNPNTYEVALQKLGAKYPEVSFSVKDYYPNAQDKYLEKAFLLEENIIGVVMTDRKPVGRYNGRIDLKDLNQDQMKLLNERCLKAKITVQYYRIDEETGIVPLEEWQLEEDVVHTNDMIHDTVKVVNTDTSVYIMVPNGETDRLEKRCFYIYNLKNKECIWEYKYDFDPIDKNAHSIGNRDILVKNGRVYFSFREYGKNVFYEICPDQAKVRRGILDGQVLGTGFDVYGNCHQKDEVYLVDHQQQDDIKVQVYSLKENRLTLVLYVPKEIRIHTIFSMGGYIIVADSKGYLIGYDSESGEKVFEQLLEKEIGDVCCSDTDSVLCSTSIQGRSEFWRLVNKQEG